MNTTIYSGPRMLVGVFIGGPFAAAFYLFRTLKALEKPKIAVYLGVIVPMLVLGLGITAAFIPQFANLPDLFWHLLEIGVVLGFTRGYVLEEIRAHIKASKPVYGWGNTLLVAFVSLAASLLLMLPFIFYGLGGAEPMTKKTFGNLKHEIYFDPANVTEPEVTRVAGALTATGFFDEKLQKGVELSRSETTYIITIFFSKDANRPEVLEPYRRLRDEIQKAFPIEHIVIDMATDTRENRFARLE